MCFWTNTYRTQTHIHPISPTQSYKLGNSWLNTFLRACQFIYTQTHIQTHTIWQDRGHVQQVYCTAYTDWRIYRSKSMVLNKGSAIFPQNRVVISKFGAPHWWPKRRTRAIFTTHKCQEPHNKIRSPGTVHPWFKPCLKWKVLWGRGQLKCDGTRTETRFRLPAKRKSPFKSAGASVQSTTGSRGVRISGSNAGYTMFRGSVKGTGYPLHSPVSPLLPLPCVTVCYHISTGVYAWRLASVRHVNAYSETRKNYK